MKSFLTAQEQLVLEKACRQKTVAHRLVERSQVILAYSRLATQSQLSIELSRTRSFVIRWINRWKQKQADRTRLREEYEQGAISQSKYEKEVLSLLSDEKRSGAPLTFSAHQRQQLLAIACQTPADFGLPFTHWTQALLSEQAQQAGIVISSRHLGRLLKTSPAQTAPECLLARTQD